MRRRGRGQGSLALRDSPSGHRELRQAAGPSEGALCRTWGGSRRVSGTAEPPIILSIPCIIVSYVQAPSTDEQWNGNQVFLKVRATGLETELRPAPVQSPLQSPITTGWETHALRTQENSRHGKKPLKHL